MPAERRQDEVVLAAVNRRSQALQCRVACTPLVDQEAEIAGVIRLMQEVRGQG